MTTDTENLRRTRKRRARQEYGICRSRQEISNEYLIAAIGVDEDNAVIRPSVREQTVLNLGAKSGVHGSE